jgi:hypothetical protein
MPCYAVVYHAARPQLINEEYVDAPKEKVDYGQKVARPYLLRIILQKRVPILRGRTGWPLTQQVCLNCVPGHMESEFQQLASDALRPPQSGFSAAIR